MKKKAIIIMIALIAFLGAGVYFLHIFIATSEPKGLMEYYFSEEKEQVQEHIKQLHYSYNDKIEVDDYTITLKESVVESELPKGYCLFEVRRKNHDMRENEFSSEESASSFGEDSRFCFFFPFEEVVWLSDEWKFHATKDVLYIYMEFSLLPTDKELEVYLYDSKSGKEYERYPENSVGKFTLKTYKKEKTYKDGEVDIIVTPFRILINSNNQVAVNTLKLMYEDGNSCTVIDGSIDKLNNVKAAPHGDWSVTQEQGYPGYKKRYYYDLLLKKAVDIEKIKNIEFNGKTME